MKTGTSLKNRQGGAVAVVVGIGLTLIIGFLALVIDLGHLYLARTGQQNAADAAALSGAKELVGTADGIYRARDWAQKLTAQGSGDNTGTRNQFFGNLGWENIALHEANIHFSDSPYSSTWLTVEQAHEQPAGKYFIKVDTETGAMGTWFAGIWNFFNISTYGSAVAGRFLNDIAPIGLCALDPTRREKWVQYDAGGDQYKAEFGYMRGVSYDFLSINHEIGGLAPGAELYLHPTATAASCEPNAANAQAVAPFLCAGRSNISGAAGSQVYTNVGMAAGPSIGALNTRFNEYGPPLDSSLNSTVCPPDANIREYRPGAGPGGSNGWMSPAPQPTSAFGLDDWLAGPPGSSSVARAPLLSPASAVVSASLNDGGCNGDCNDNYGVLWTYDRPAVSSVSAASSVSEVWSQLFPSGASSVGPTYTRSPGGWNAWQAPYLYDTEPVSTGVPGRRVLNVVLVNCQTTPPSGGNCQPMDVVGVGKFFMQRTATVAGWINGEFAGLLTDAELSPSIRLYR